MTHSVANAQRMYRVAALAKLWSVSTRYVYAEIRAGRLEAVQMGNGDRDVLRVSEAAAQRWQAEHVHRPTETKAAS